MTDWLNIDYRAGPGSILHEPGGISAGLLLPSTVSHHSLIPERVTARLRSTAVPARVKRFLKCFPHSVKRACIEGKPNFAAWQHSSQFSLTIWILLAVIPMGDGNFVAKCTVDPNDRLQSLEHDWLNIRTWRIEGEERKELEECKNPINISKFTRRTV